MKEFVGAILTIIAVVAIIVGGVCYVNYVNRFKPHVYSADEIYAQQCAKKGGNPITRRGYDDGIYVQEYKCEVK